MYYVFSNAKEMDAILKQGNYEALNRTFLKTKLKKKKELKKNQISAKEQYQHICEVGLKYLDVKQKKVFQLNAIDIFTKSWDVESLKMIKQNPCLYGELTDEAKNVLLEYEKYKKIAENAVISMIFEECKEKEVVVGENVKCIKVRYVGRKLSFVRKGVEYYV